MNGKIELVIALPDGIAKKLTADRVQLPALMGDITILPQRAPTLLQLKAGNIQVMDDAGKTLEEISITNGFADIAEDKCFIAVSALS